MNERSEQHSEYLMMIADGVTYGESAQWCRRMAGAGLRGDPIAPLLREAREKAAHDPIEILAQILAEYDQTYDAQIHADGAWTAAASIPLQLMERAKACVKAFREPAPEVRA